MELRGEDLVCYSNKIESVGLRNVRMVINLLTGAYLGGITVTNISQVLPTRWRQQPAGIDVERNYVIVTLCIQVKLC